MNMDFSVNYSQNKVDDIDLNIENTEQRFEDLEKKKDEIRNIFDLNVLDKSSDVLADWLEDNKFYLLVDKIDAGELSENELINMPDDKILEFVEEHNKPRFNKLREFLMKLDENQDADDLLQSIEKQTENYD